MRIQATHYLTVVDKTTGQRTQLWYVDTPTQTRSWERWIATRSAIIRDNGIVTNQCALANGQVRIFYDVPVEGGGEHQQPPVEAEQEATCDSPAA